MTRRVSALDVWLALYALVYGLWLLLPIDTFGSAPVFAGLKQIAPEPVWGLIIAGSGAAKMAALRWGNTLARRAILFWLFILWMFLAASVALANAGSTAVPTYVLMAGGAGYCYVRMGR